MKIVIALLMLSSQIALAGFQGSVTFTDQEKARHYLGLPEVLEGSANCLNNTLQYHQSFYAENGISPFYGDQSMFGVASYAEKRSMLQDIGVSTKLLETLEPISCVGLAIRCLKEGFKAAGQEDIWAKLYTYLKANDVDGTALQDGLQKLGWKIYYWNPDLNSNARWDDYERRYYPGNPQKMWGMHQERWEAVKRTGKYQNNTVDDITSLVNFKNRTPELVRQAQFFLGSAHAGFHVFPGTFGNVVEGHSARAITDAHTIEASPFNPMDPQGGPQGHYLSGIIALPPR